MLHKKYHGHRHRNGYMNGSAVDGSANGLDPPPEVEIKYRPNPENFLPIPRLKFSAAAVIVFITSIVCFAVSYDGEFVFDDSEAVVGNKDLMPETPISNIFVNDFWGNKLASKTSHKSYRPLTILTFRLSYAMGGGLSPAWFHIPNIILHGVISVLLLNMFSILFGGLSYALGGGLSPAWFHIPNIILHGVISVLLLNMFSILFGGYSVSLETKQKENKAAKSSFLCALLFAVHPIHTESVSGVVGRADLLCAVLFIGSFLFYVKSCAVDLKPKEDKLVLYRPERFSLQNMLVSMLLCGLSVFCKEQGIAVIGICSAYDIIMVCGVDLVNVVGLRGKTHKNGNGNGKSKEVGANPWVISLVKRHVVMVTTGVIVLLFRVRIMGSAPPTFQLNDNPHSFVNGTLLRGINYSYLYSINFWLLLNPWWLCFDWSMGCVPTIDGFSDPRILSGVAIWICIGTLIWTCLRTPVSHDQRVLTMSLALIIVPFLPASNLFFRVGFVIAERILYLPSIGFCIITVTGVRQLCVTIPKHSKMVLIGFCFLLSIFTARSIQRSNQWRTEEELFTSGSLVCSQNAKVHYNIGKINADRGNTDYAIIKYRDAIELNPQYDQAMNNLGNILKDRNELDEAERLLEKAVSIRYEFAAAWMNLGIVKAALKKHKESEHCYITAIKHRNKYPDCYYNLGNLYLDVKLYDRAVEAWINATNLKPAHSLAWSNLAIVYDNLERYDESIKASMTGLKHLPGDPQLLFNLGNVYGKLEKYTESEKYFLKAIKRTPNNSKFYGNLGVLYHRWKKYDKAEMYYKKALAINPQEPNVNDNLNMLLRAVKTKS